MGKIIFVGSTFLDLEAHRSLVRDAITRLDHNTKAMEFFGALPDTPKAECLRLVRSADVYVGIFGMRYGYVDAATNKSMTQLEYEEAQALRIPSLVYVIDEHKHPVLPAHIEHGPGADKLRELKKTLLNNHVVNKFSSPEDLAAKVTQDLVRLLGARETTPTAKVLSQLAANTLTRHPLTEDRFYFFREKCEHFFPIEVPDALLRESLELVLGGERLAAALVLTRGTSMELRDAVDGLIKFTEYIDALYKNYVSKEQAP